MELQLGQKVMVDAVFEGNKGQLESVEGVIVGKRTINTYHGKETNYDIDTKKGKLHTVMRYFIKRL